MQLTARSSSSLGIGSSSTNRNLFFVFVMYLHTSCIRNNVVLHGSMALGQKLQIVFSERQFPPVDFVLLCGVQHAQIGVTAVSWRSARDGNCSQTSDERTIGSSVRASKSIAVSIVEKTSRFLRNNLLMGESGTDVFLRRHPKNSARCGGTSTSPRHCLC